MSSPASWISDKVWTALSQRTSNQKKRAEYTGGNPRETIRSPRLLEVTDFDRRRIPSPATASHTLAQSPNLPTLRRRLLSTHGPFQLRSPIWPVCCATLATLIQSQGKGVSLKTLEETHGPQDQAFLENELRSWGGPNACHDTILRQGWGDILTEIRANRHSGTGLNLFRCKLCQRHYIASCSP